MASNESTTFNVSGIEVHVYGLQEFQRHATISSVDLVFLLHGRTQTYKTMEATALAILQKDQSAKPLQRGLLVVAFDHRNHGHRQISQLANLGWADGNDLHAQDMYFIQYGTSRDVSDLITFLPAYLFPRRQCTFANIICAGISLGGHSTYLVLSHDERVAAGVVVIGCPDMHALLIPRAGEELKDKRLPPSFLAIVARLDPQLELVSRKDLLILKGDEDASVPWSASEAFVSRLPPAKTEVVGYPGVGHAYTEVMVEKCVDWIVKWRRQR